LNAKWQLRQLVIAFDSQRERRKGLKIEHGNRIKKGGWTDSSSV
jgi:ribosome-associated protein YbcJ (S4-like RNA binding protein)